MWWIAIKKSLVFFLGLWLVLYYLVISFMISWRGVFMLDMFFAPLCPRVGFIHLSWVHSFSEKMSASISCLCSWGPCPQGVRNWFQQGNTFSDASLQQPTCYMAIAGRTSLSCWSPHREISPLKGGCVCVCVICSPTSIPAFTLFLYLPTSESGQDFRIIEVSEEHVWWLAPPFLQVLQEQKAGLSNFLARVFLRGSAV